jgi:hypothetical protein
VSDEALMRFLPGRSQSDAPVALAVFWPEPQYLAVIARWPGLAALLGSTCPDLRTVAPAAMTAWPPERNARCWCGSGAKYKRCCRLRA